MKLFAAHSEGGQTVGKLAVAIAIVGIVVSIMVRPAYPRVLPCSSAQPRRIRFSSLMIEAAECIILEMGMPTMPACMAIISVMGPILQGFGMDLLAAHVLAFSSGVAAGIKPPVAITAYYAASVSGRRPVATAVEFTWMGAIIFLIPFEWAFYGSLLLGLGQGGVAQVFLALAFLITALYLRLAR